MSSGGTGGRIGARGRAVVALAVGLLALIAGVSFVVSGRNGALETGMALAILGYLWFPLLGLTAGTLLVVAALLVLAARI